MGFVRALLGILFLLGIALLFSKDRKNIHWRLVGVGIALQVIFGLLITKIPLVKTGFNWISSQFVVLLGFTEDGARFLFGNLIGADSLGFIFALQVLPTVIFFSTLTAGLYYLGVLQYIVKGIAWLMARTMRLSGAEALSAAGNIFLGQTEAPLLVRPFVSKMTHSELMCLMTGGMATIAGGVLAGYVAFLGGNDPVDQERFASYLLSASIMNAPAAIVMSKIMLPELYRDRINSDLKVAGDSVGVNLIDALANGASDGLKLALNIGAMLLAFIALIAAVNYVLLAIGDVIGLNEIIVQSTNGAFQGFSLEYMLGQLFRIFAFAIGVDWSESLAVGSLLGQKVVVNEFVAYLGLSDFVSTGALSNKSIVIATYALCGFANFSSIAIQIGGIGGMAPTQQGNISKLGIRALIAATMATMMTASIAGALVS
ncbi:NupC/NupG family nucleoside CNT transporter [Marinoscillum sp. MHG1-6]|uniref:NupC/NupG family nucleoside CNT transporter n=1 Tax=Marinoscillum sp. MHG1-6 TaxID=2959627 RepID=UPI0021585383|nr:nucleoside transporter C-terminal domain-containing protein [Marinoscillum sp. MHG1-6]